jgi:flavin reductase
MNVLSPHNTSPDISDFALSPDLFKSAMRRIASTVCVLTTLHDGKRWGMTATAVCSLTAEPPSLIACINRSATAHDAIMASQRICINILTEEQAETAKRLSGVLGHSGERRFEDEEWYALETGAPALRGAAVAFDCVVVESLAYKTHSVLVCLPRAIELGTVEMPLLYSDRNYTRVRPW